MKSLLAIDIGNSNTVFGVYEGATLTCHWRVQTSGRRTADEYAVLVRSLMARRNIEPDNVSHAVIFIGGATSSARARAIFGTGLRHKCCCRRSRDKDRDANSL